MEHIYSSISKKLKDRDILNETCSQVDFNIQVQRHNMTMEDVYELESLLTDVLRKYKDVKQFQKPKNTYTNNTIDKILKDTNAPTMDWYQKLVFPKFGNHGKQIIVSTPRQGGKSLTANRIVLENKLHGAIKKKFGSNVKVDDDMIKIMAKSFAERTDASLIDGLGLGHVIGKCRTAIFRDNPNKGTREGIRSVVKGVMPVGVIFDEALEECKDKPIKGQRSIKLIIDKYRIVA